MKTGVMLRSSHLCTASSKESNLTVSFLSSSQSTASLWEARLLLGPKERYEGT